MESTHWGEKDSQKEEEHVPDVTHDIELSMNKLFLNALEEGEDSSGRTQQIVVPPLNPLVRHAISLHKHANAISELIKQNESKIEKVELKLKMPQYEASCCTNETKLNFSTGDFLKFNKNEEVQLCELSRNIVQQILIKCIATLFAQIGYETSQQSALDVLRDVLQEFLKKICHQVKVAIEDTETHSSGFPHVIERVLTEMGMGGVKCLDDYYKSRVVNYINVLENRCKNLTKEYEALLIPKSPSPVDKFNKVIRVKVEEEDDVVEVENPEVHFSTIEGDVNLSILETGYQLLNSLEAETNLHTTMVEEVEDIASTESPGIVYLSSEDTAHLSPYSKKKRFK